ERSLMQATSDPAHRPQFYRDLAAADLFFIHEGPLPGNNGQIVLKEGSSLKIRHIEWKGKPFIPVFSSPVRLQAVVQSEASYLALNALEFMSITRGAELFLNPGSEFCKEFTRAEIDSLLDGSIWKPSERYVAEKDTTVMIGQPPNYPKQLVDTLTR